MIIGSVFFRNVGPYGNAKRNQARMLPHKVNCTSYFIKRILWYTKECRVEHF